MFCTFFRVTLRHESQVSNRDVVLSGMSNMPKMEDNLGTMKVFKPLTSAEMDALQRVRDIYKGLNLIPCTACRYCIEENKCPKSILIPDMFSAINTHETFQTNNSSFYYNNSITGGDHGKASDCISCGKCEKVCPQHLPIRELLRDVVKTFE